MTDLDVAWAEVTAAGDRLRATHLRDLFATDPSRFDRFSAEGAGVFVDLSKEKIDPPALEALLRLGQAANVTGRREAMFAGEKINTTEDRAVLHTALRAGDDAVIRIDGADIMTDVRRERDRMLGFAEDIRTDRVQTIDDKPFTDVVHIGIGGSALGPEMVVLALAPWHDGPRIHFVSNIDGAALRDTLFGLDPARTLVTVASKSFTTLETMTNARAARRWLAEALGDQAGAHMAAMSTNLAATSAFGIDDARVFGFWDWVGGRFSVWSAIGLPVALGIGPANFRALLDGARAMDTHFQTAPEAENLPLLLGLIGVWRRNVMGWPVVAVVPYDQRLSRLPALLQQIDMESNGKRVTLSGAPAQQATGPVIFGEPGTNAQHSFFQLLHQGTDVMPADFILAARPTNADAIQHRLLIASALAQSAALAFGDPGATDPHRVFPGDRPSTVIMLDQLTPAALGSLIALYEHKIFVQGVIWGINSFDQFGVELGKSLTAKVLPALEGGDVSGFDCSTRGLIVWLRGA